MHILFVDESGTAPEPSKVDSEPIFTLGGIIVPEDIWSKLRDDLNRVKAQYKITGEIKWRNFSPNHEGKSRHAMSHLSNEDKSDVRSKLFASINSYRSVRIVAAVADTKACYKRHTITDADDLYHFTFKALSERFQYFLQDLERDSGVSMKGMIVADNRNSGQDKRLREFHQQLLNGGANKSTYANLIEGLFIAASHESPGTQLADLVAGAIHRSERRGDHRFLDQIEGRMRRGPRGQIPGYGIAYVK